MTLNIVIPCVELYIHNFLKWITDMEQRWHSLFVIKTVGRIQKDKISYRSSQLKPSPFQKGGLYFWGFKSLGGGFEIFEIQGAPFVLKPPIFSRGVWIFIMKMQSPGFKKQQISKKYRLRRAIFLWRFNNKYCYSM